MRPLAKDNTSHGSSELGDGTGAYRTHSTHWPGFAGPLLQCGECLGRASN